MTVTKRQQHIYLTAVVALIALVSAGAYLRNLDDSAPLPIPLSSRAQSAENVPSDARGVLSNAPPRAVAGDSVTSTADESALILGDVETTQRKSEEIRVELARMDAELSRYRRRLDSGPYEEIRATRSLALNSICVVLRAQGRSKLQADSSTRQNSECHFIISNCGTFELPIGEYPVFDEIQRIANEATQLRDARKEVPNSIHAEHRAFAERMYAEAIAWIEDGR
jgi:hypothetical protein